MADPMFWQFVKSEMPMDGMRDDALLWQLVGAVRASKSHQSYEMAVLADYVQEKYPKQEQDILGGVLVDLWGWKKAADRLDQMTRQMVARASDLRIAGSKPMDVQIQPPGMWIMTRLALTATMLDTFDLDARGIHSVFISHRTPGSYVNSFQIEAGMTSGRSWQIKTSSRWGYLGLDAPSYKYGDVFPVPNTDKDNLLVFINLKRAGRERDLGEPWQYINLQGKHPPISTNNQNPVTAHGFYRWESRDP